MTAARTTISKRLLARMFRHLSPSLQRHMADLVARSAEEIAYRRLKDNGFTPSAIIDVGAFHGDWSRLANRIFGPTPTLMVEAQPDKKAVLETVAHDLPHARLAMAVLGETSGADVTFYEMGTGSSFLPEASDAPRTEIRLKTRTLDDVVAENLDATQSIFLKIDVQGAELHVLRGAAATLEKVELIQLETAMLQYNEGAPLLPEVAAFMADNDFFPVEVSGYSRPKDHLVQIDLMFARSNSSLRPNYFHF